MLMLKVLETFFRNAGVGGWRLSCMLMWMCVCVSCPACSSLCSVTSLLCQGLDCLLGPVCVCSPPPPGASATTDPSDPRSYDRPPHQALQEGLFICLYLHLCVHCLMIMMMMSLPSMPSASLLQPPWRWSPGCNPTRCRDKKICISNTKKHHT